mmetsp:Transcript_45490/g.101660  ORF Transcript_45490/g.101660 Transcript_45490/m.101660 type:complete len:580 (+) Transcript_45490:207-1946(+)
MSEKKLWMGAAVMIFGPMVVLFGVNALYWLAYQLLYRLSEEPESNMGLWPVFMSLPGPEHCSMIRHKMKKIVKPVPFFPALLTLMVGVFLATAAQFVITHYGLMVRTGSRNICFYNERCYYPGVVWDIPWNHFLSNLAYFVAGAHTMLQAFFAEVRCRSFSRRCVENIFRSVRLSESEGLPLDKWCEIFDAADLNRSGAVSRYEWSTLYGNSIAYDFLDKNKDGRISREEWVDAFHRLDTLGKGCLTEAQFMEATTELDLRAFYAIAITFVGEGIGSMCYHMCPSVETFQFDTCFMIPIANLLTIALADWSGTPFDTISSLKYFVYILTPIWIINFVGTWYDIKVFDSKWLYWTYAICTLVWTIAAVSGMKRVFATPEIGRCGFWMMRTLQTLVVLVVSLAFVVPPVRATLGGTANTFLLLSIVIMLVVVIRQVYLLDARYITCQARAVGARLIKYSYLFVMGVVTAYAIKCFNAKVVIVTPDATPAESHDVNQDCVWGIFDLHDWWHFLSAIGLALMAMLLLDVRVNSWARKTGVSILFEKKRTITDSEYDFEACFGDSDATSSESADSEEDPRTRSI